MRNWKVLTDLDFEALSCDLLAVSLGTIVERFAGGADGGIDLRWKTAAGGIGIAQCKHYSSSTFSQLFAAAKKEVSKVTAQTPKEYKFITTFDLGVGQKDRIYNLFSTWMHGPQDVYSASDLDALLSRYPDVERRHIKLWLSTGSQLFWSTHSDLVNRSEALRERVERTLPTYVPSNAFQEALTILDRHKTCLIAGEPGIGKTVLACMLLAESIARGFEPCEVSGDINEAWTALSSDHLQVFLYDDFLGQISFSERMGKNEDRRLADFINKISTMKSKRLILTTREYILRDARQDYRLLRDMNEELHFLLELHDYSRNNKALILYNHLWQATVAAICLRELLNKGWVKIIDHPNYSPRLIEYCTGSAFDLTSPGYVDRFVDTLDHPEEVWSSAYERHLTDEQRALPIVLSSMPVQVDLDDLHRAHIAYCELTGIATSARSFRTALEVTEGTFIALSKRGDVPVVQFHSPSVAEFILDQLIDDAYMLSSLLNSVVFFEQLRNLRSARSGGAAPGAQHSGRRLLSLPLGSLRAQFVSALQGTFNGPTPDRLSNQGRFVTGYEPPYGLIEERMIYLWQLPDGWQPSEEWIHEKLLGISNRWSKKIGSKRRALELLQLVESYIPEEIASTMRTTLESWLSSDLSETPDWSIYLEYLEEAEGDYFPPRLASSFCEHALSELDRWHPSPPELDDLINYAHGFDLEELEEKLKEKAHEDEERETQAEDKLSAEQRPSPTSPKTENSDSSIESLFTRLARS